MKTIKILIILCCVVIAILVLKNCKKQEVVVSDQMFEPINPNMPEQMYHNFIRNYSYTVIGKFTDKTDGRKKLRIKDGKNNKYTISIMSIKHPAGEKFSKKHCRVKASEVENNGKYVFFREDVYYQYKENSDGTYLVLGDKRNKVTLYVDQIILE